MASVSFSVLILLGKSMRESLRGLHLASSMPIQYQSGVMC